MRQILRRPLSLNRCCNSGVLAQLYKIIITNGKYNVKSYKKD